MYPTEYDPQLSDPYNQKQNEGNFLAEKNMEVYRLRRQGYIDAVEQVMLEELIRQQANFTLNAQDEP